MAPPTLPSGSHRLVRVYLFDLQSREIIPERSIFLQPPLFDVKIGRGSQTEASLHPQKSNAWFTSRVMSREHAVLRADPSAKVIYLEDTGSMHGTFLEGARLEQGKPVAIKNNEKIQFGTEIVRGDQVYKPLQLSLGIDWDDCYLPSPTRTRSDVSIPLKNTFTIDYSDDEGVNDDDDDVRFVSESISLLPPTTYRQPRTFSVPDSDDTDSSDNEKLVDNESAPSSPTEVGYNTSAAKTSSSLTTVTQKPKGVTENLSSPLPGSTIQSALDVSDDEDGRDDMSNESANEEIDPVGIRSDEDHYSSDEDEEGGAMFDSDFDDDEDENEELDVEEGATNAPNDHDHQAAQPPVHDRAPSPSDAALPKPKRYPSTWYPSLNPQSPSITFNGVTGVFHPGSSTLSNYQPPFGYYTDMSWSNNQGNTAFNGSFDQLPEFSTIPPIPPIQSNLTPSINGPHCFQSPKFSDQVAGNWPHYPPPPRAISIKPSKVSINDIIEDIRPGHNTVTMKLKRKAEEISNIEPAERFQESEAQPPTTTSTEQEQIAVTGETPLNTPDEATESQAKSDSTCEKTTPSKKVVTFSPDTVIINPDSQRPRKKVKVQHGSGGSPFLKYFAATVAGATLGAVGTVFGLAALPVDYFG